MDQLKNVLGPALIAWKKVSMMVSFPQMIIFSLKSNMSLTLKNVAHYQRVNISNSFSKVRLHKNKVPQPIKTSGIQFLWYIFKSIRIHDLKRAM